MSRLRDQQAVGKLFVELGPRYKARPGGYLRILKCGNRPATMLRWPMSSLSIVRRSRSRLLSKRLAVVVPKPRPGAGVFFCELDGFRNIVRCAKVNGALNPAGHS